MRLLWDRPKNKNIEHYDIKGYFLVYSLNRDTDISLHEDADNKSEWLH
jgi:hypothetical protein